MRKLNSTFVLLLFIAISRPGISSGQESLASRQDLSLKDVVGDRFKIGVGVGERILSDPASADLICKHFQILTPENCMKPQGIHPSEDQWNFDASDRFVDFAKQNKLELVGHCLVWAKDDRTDDWMKVQENGEPVSQAKLLQRINDHVKTVVDRYQETATMWDVVNEALSDGDDGYLRDSIYSRTTGIEFIDSAFRTARQHDPDALLIYNDYNCHFPGKRKKLIRLLTELKERGVPIDAYGMQGHFELGDSSLSQLRETFSALRDLDIKVVVSELDIDVVTRGRWWADGGRYREELKTYDPYKEGLPKEIEQQEMEQYVALFRLFDEYQDVIARVSFWNLHDGQSWLNDFPWERTNYPLLFDRQLKPKPVFDAVCDAMLHPSGVAAESRPLLMAHYMPWYSAKPKSDQWGWHWTMNHFDPDKQVEGKREIASKFYPLIGPYDSNDANVLEYHLLTMKMAGIDGVIVDWYGLSNFRDYAILHRNTTRLLQQCERLKMKFIICYEDQTIPALVQANRITSNDSVSHAANEIEWLNKYWFQSPSYLRLDGKPVLLSFGHAGLTNDEWSQCLSQLEFPVAYFSQDFCRSGAIGGFGWPAPKVGLQQVQRFLTESANWNAAIPAAFPRFDDIYREAKVSEGYPLLPDKNGSTFQATLESALKSKAAIIQLATWNDWGEGTQIEPSREFGYRDLEWIQETRRNRLESDFAFSSDDLRLPSRLLELRRSDTHSEDVLDAICEAICAGNLEKAHQRIDAITREDNQ